MAGVNGDNTSPVITGAPLLMPKGFDDWVDVSVPSATVASQTMESPETNGPDRVFPVLEAKFPLILQAKLSLKESPSGSVDV